MIDFRIAIDITDITAEYYYGFSIIMRSFELEPSVEGREMKELKRDGEIKLDYKIGRKLSYLLNFIEWMIVIVYLFEEKQSADKSVGGGSRLLKELNY